MADEAGLGAAGDDDVSLALAEVVGGGVEAVVGGGAGGGDGIGGAHKASVNSEHSGPHIEEVVGDKVGAHIVNTVLKEGLYPCLQYGGPTHP